MSWRAFFVVFLMPALVLAQSPPVKSIPPGDDKIVPVAKGAKAPFSGQLFDPLTALRWGNYLQQYKYRLAWDVKKEQSFCRIKTEYDGKLLAIEKKRATRVSKDLRSRLLVSEKARLVAEEEARNPPWYRSTQLGLGLGVVGTVAVVVVAAYALNAVSPAVK